MKFGIFYEHQHPQPWTEGSEPKLYQDALDQVELADRVGIDYVREVEAAKQRELAPFIEAALARKPRMAPIAPESVPTAEAFGRRSAAVRATFSDRGGAISIPQADPAARPAAE